jgi:hypothetical protein
MSNVLPHPRTAATDGCDVIDTRRPGFLPRSTMARRNGGNASIDLLTHREMVATAQSAADVENGRRQGGALAR